MYSRLFLPIAQMARCRFPNGFFKVNTRLKIEGFDPVWCREMAAILRELRMENGLSRRSISYSPTPQSVPIVPNSKETVFRGFPLSNLFLKRKATDGGVFTIPASLTDELSTVQDMFEMAEYMKDKESEAAEHLFGITTYRSYTEDPSVAFAFALAKGHRDGAIAIEHWAKEGSVLLASLYGPAAKKDWALVQGLLYQKEIAGPILPFARQKCTTIFYKEDRCLNPESGFNIISPFNLNIDQFLLANGDATAVKMIHEYDQQALRASMEFSDACRNLLEGQMKHLSDFEMRVIYERFCSTYQKMIDLEEQFRKKIVCIRKKQVEQGNHLMEQTDRPSDVSLDKGLCWYLSAICYSKGTFLTPTGNECSLNVNKKGDLILEWSQGFGTTISRTFTKEEALTIIPHIMLPAFDLISPDGQFNISETLPEPVKQMLVTSFITQLMNKHDPDVGKLKFQARDANEVSSLCEKAVNNLEDLQSMSMER